MKLFDNSTRCFDLAECVCFPGGSKDGCRRPSKILSGTITGIDRPVAGMYTRTVTIFGSVCEREVRLENSEDSGGGIIKAQNRDFMDLSLEFGASMVGLDPFFPHPQDQATAYKIISSVS